MLDYADIIKLVSDAVMQGYMLATRSLEPSLDKVRRPEAIAWLRMYGFKAGTLDSFIEQGLVKPHRMGPAKNSPIYFSKAELQQAIITKRVASINNNQAYYIHE